MKKIITILISAVLIVTAILCQDPSNDIVAGKGKKENQKVTTPEQLLEVINGTCRSLSVLGAKKEELTAHPTDSTEEARSVTMLIESTQACITKCNDSHNLVDMYTSTQLSMKYYIASDGQIMISIIGDITTEDNLHLKSSNIFYDTDLYLGTEKAAIRYNACTVDGNTVDFLLGQWWDINSLGLVTSTDIIQLVELDKRSLQCIEEYITDHQNDAFRKDKDKLIMLNDFVKDFIMKFSIAYEITSTDFVFTDQMNYIDSDEIYMDMDFSEETAPILNIREKNLEMSAELSGYTYQFSLNTDYSAQFTNINNTVIEFHPQKIMNFNEYSFQ